MKLIVGLLLAAGLMAGGLRGSEQPPFKPAAFCDRNPGHWKCNPTPTPPPTATPTPTPTATPAPTPTPTPVPTPTSTPPPVGDGFYISVVLVQNETGAGFDRMEADHGGRVFVGHHMHAFGAACNYPTDVVTRLGWAGNSIHKMLYAAIAPADLDVNGVGCAGNNSRLRDTPQVETFAHRTVDVLNADLGITHVNFWNELKGYWSSSLNNWDVDRFNRDYITFATIVKAARPDIQVGGPYTSGGMTEAHRDRIHQSFITNVVEPHPDLVDFIAWDHNDGQAHEWYTGLYSARGVTLPHWNVEYYPGGWNTSDPPTVAEFRQEVLNMAANPLMAGAFIWSGGSDPAMKTPLWNSSGVPTAYWTELVNLSTELVP